MTTEHDTAPSGRYQRKSPKQIRPNRRAANFYRTAEAADKALGGIPLADVNAAVVAAVRMGYEVAEAQIERSTRLAERLRKAGDQAVGPDSDRKSLDAAERLVFRAMMSGLSWLEGAAAEGGSPLKRMAEAEYKLMGSLFGLTQPDAAQASRDAATAKRHARSDRADAAAGEGAPVRATAGPALEIRHLGQDRRAVRVEHSDIAGVPPSKDPIKVHFYSVDQIKARPLEAEFVVNDKGSARLSLETKRLTPPGLWRAAICDNAGLQLGLIEINL